MVVFITGATSGIGEQTAYAFAKEGSHVIVGFHTDLESAERIAAQCERLGAPSSFTVHLDLLQESSIAHAMQETMLHCPHIDILINNAGVGVWKPLREQSMEDIDLQLKTNLEGLIFMTQACLPFLKHAIINVGSGAGLTGYADLSVYCATKFAVRGFTQSIAKELPYLDVFTVNPGMTATRMTNFHGTPPEKVAEVIVHAAGGDFRAESGADINVWEYEKEYA